jgi:hypothetical protein
MKQMFRVILAVCLAAGPAVTGRGQTAPNSACTPQYNGGFMYVFQPAGGRLSLRWDYNLGCLTASRAVTSDCAVTLIGSAWELYAFGWAPASFGNGGTAGACGSVGWGCNSTVRSVNEWNWTSSGPIVPGTATAAQIRWIVTTEGCVAKPSKIVFEQTSRISL